MTSQELRLRFWGVRGTVATPAADKLRYGGNTACAAVAVTDDTYVVLDCGTGVRLFGSACETARAGRPTRYHVFLSHYHLDHVEGLALFMPLYDPASHITFSGLAPQGRTVRDVLEALVAPPYFPVPLSGAPARVDFRAVDDAPVDIGPLRVTAMPLCHPDGSIAYRLEHAGRRIVFATDHEHGNEAFDRRLVAFSRGADYLIYDATYMESEYETLRKGWGHSTWYAGVAVAREAGVGSLVLFHHHPEHTDDQLDAMERIARAEMPSAVVAREGMELPF